MQPRELYPHLLVTAQPDVHCLDRLTRRAFHQVVDGSHHHHAIAMRIDFPADVAEVAASEDLGLGVAVNAAVLLDQTDEGFLAVGAAKDFPEVAVGGRLAEEDVTGGEHAAHRLDGSGGERYRGTYSPKG